MCFNSKIVIQPFSIVNRYLFVLDFFFLYNKILSIFFQYYHSYLLKVFDLKNICPVSSGCWPKLNHRKITDFSFLYCQYIYISIANNSKGFRHRHPLLIYTIFFAINYYNIRELMMQTLYKRHLKNLYDTTINFTS